jgi:hypothetical protein
MCLDANDEMEWLVRTIFYTTRGRLADSSWRYVKLCLCVIGRASTAIMVVIIGFAAVCFPTANLHRPRRTSGAEKECAGRELPH